MSQKKPQQPTIHHLLEKGPQILWAYIARKIQGKRPGGRSPMRWTYQIRANTETTISVAIHTAENRVGWRDFVRGMIARRDHNPQ